MDRMQPPRTHSLPPFENVEERVVDVLRDKLIYQRKMSSDGPREVDVHALRKSANALRQHFTTLRHLRSADNLTLNARIENHLRHSLDQLMTEQGQKNYDQTLNKVTRALRLELMEAERLRISKVPKLAHADLMLFGLCEFLDVMDFGNPIDREKLKLTLFTDNALTPGQQDDCLNAMVDFVRHYWKAGPEKRSDILNQADDTVIQFCKYWTMIENRKNLFAIPGCNQAIDIIVQGITPLRPDYVPGGSSNTSNDRATEESSASNAGSGEAPARRSTLRPRNPRQAARPPQDAAVAQGARTRVPKNVRPKS